MSCYGSEISDSVEPHIARFFDDFQVAFPDLRQIWLAYQHMFQVKRIRDLDDLCIFRCG